jgi:hypothetical protein
VPDRGPQPSTRAVIEAHRRRLAAARVHNRQAAADIESQAGQFSRGWQASLRNSERIASARAREAEIWRQVDALQRAEEFTEAREAFRMSQDRERFRAAWRRSRA